ncbi:MAG: T9SS type A sorting domain-containing protein [Bacteroidetes bacterium]|nr:T9SS type A sorting domain-containing protein [Bacteroidota bacterium]
MKINQRIKIFVFVLSLVVYSIKAQTILGLDVSSYQGSINWTSVKGAGYTFAWAKATEGLTVTDSYFTSNITNGEAAGMYMGGYHFAHPDTHTTTAGATAEANFFLSVAQPYIVSCQLPPVLDYEVSTSLSWAAQTTWIQTWCSTVQAATGITPIIYTSGSIANSLGSSLATQYKLWVADPDGNPTAAPSSTYLGVWYPNYSFKQYSWTGTVPGISGSGNVDLDYFHGTMSDLTSLMSCGAPPSCHTYYASVPYFTSFESWMADSCTAGYPAGRLPDQYWKSSIGGTSPSGYNYWHRNDYSGADWPSVTSGSYTPSASNGNYSARFRNYAATAGSTGAMDLYINLMAPGTKTVNFDYIHNESAPAPFQLQVLLSTDGGATFPVSLYTITTTQVPSWTTQTFTTNATSPTSVLRFIATDKGLNDIGIDNLHVIRDTIAPTTSVTVSGTWQTQNFTANFTDVDNTGGSGVEKGYYQAIYYDGTKWGANYTHGFYADDFNGPSINPNWTQKVGTWSISSSSLYQSDATQANTNIYAPLTQTLSNRYLYRFSMSVAGAGTNRRAGFHFFCDQPDSSNRNNSYFVWFRLDSKQLQIYKVVNNVFGSPVYSSPMNINVGQSYDYVVVYDRISGVMRVYQNSVLIGSWTDPSPYTSGAYVSFRTGNATTLINQFRVYRSRSASTTISVGSGNAYDLEYQNPNPTTPAAHINSVCNDNSGNLSAFVSQPVNIDWTPPTGLTAVNNATNTVCSNTTALSANWSTASDVNSGMAYYQYAIGTTPGASNVVSWTNIGNVTSTTQNGLSLSAGQMYYFSVKAVDGAGLTCDSINGPAVQAISCATGIEQIAANGALLLAYPNPSSGMLTLMCFASTENAEVQITDVLGHEVLKNQSIQLKNHTAQIDVSLWPEGVYFVRVGTYTQKIVVQH